MQSFGKHLIFEVPIISDIMEFYFCGLLFSWLEIFETGSYYVAQVTLEPTI